MEMPPTFSYPKKISIHQLGEVLYPFELPNAEKKFISKNLNSFQFSIFSRNQTKYKQQCY
jgi:hypothetical protein